MEITSTSTGTQSFAVEQTYVRTPTLEQLSEFIDSARDLGVPKHAVFSMHLTSDRPSELMPEPILVKLRWSVTITIDGLYGEVNNPT